MISWFRAHDLSLALAVGGLFAATFVLLMRGLPARTFYVGDPGLKLAVARNAIDRPAHPLDIDVPRIGGHPTVRFLDPMFYAHGDHAHAMTPELFPLISAPLIAKFGIRGAFVLPGLGFVLMVAASAWLGAALERRRWLTGIVIVATVCTPLLFYALEFWEHTLAVGIAALATALLVERRSVGPLFASGTLLGIAVMLRPEAVWYSAAVSLGTLLPPLRFGAKQIGMVMAGGVVACLPLVTYSAMHSGQFFSGHAATNLSLVTERWLSVRIDLVRLWFVPGRLLLATACTLTAAAVMVMNATPSKRRVVCVISGSFVAAVAVAAARGLFPLASIWNAAPGALLALTIPWRRERNGERFLLTVAVVSSLLVTVTAPNDGGGQWGPRYLLFAFIPIAILTADALESMVRSSRWGMAAAVVIVLASLFVQRDAYRELRGAKQAYNRILDFVERETPREGYIVTDLWWLGQVTASLYPTRVVLFASDAIAAEQALVLLAEAHVPDVSIVRSRSESPQDVFARWYENTGFVLTRQSEIPERTLTVINVQLRDRR